MFSYKYVCQSRVAISQAISVLISTRRVCWNICLKSCIIVSWPFKNPALGTCSQIKKQQLGIIFKWHHAFFDVFWPPPIVTPFSTVVTKSLTPFLKGRDIIYERPLGRDGDQIHQNKIRIITNYLFFYIFLPLKCQNSREISRWFLFSLYDPQNQFS